MANPWNLPESVSNDDLKFSFNPDPKPSPAPTVAAPAAAAPQALTKRDLEAALRKNRHKLEAGVLLLALCIWHPIGWGIFGTVLAIALAWELLKA